MQLMQNKQALWSGWREQVEQARKAAVPVERLSMSSEQHVGRDVCFFARHEGEEGVLSDRNQKR